MTALRRALPGMVLLAILAPASAGGQAAAPPRYTVTVDGELSHLAITACFPGRAPAALEVADAAAARHLTSADSGDPDAARHSGRLRLGGLGAGDCAHYTVTTADAGAGPRRGLAVAAPQALLLAPQLFIWYPQGLSHDVEVTFELPPGMDVSVPWRRVAGDDGHSVYRTGPRPPSWDARVAVGRIHEARVDLPGGHLDVALLAGDPPLDADATLGWLRAHGEALTRAHGRLPVPRVQVLVVPLGRGDEPVPWAQVTRGGGDAVHLFIDQRRDPRAFRADWVPIHEFSHLLHPLLEGRGRWVYEGLASYYQNTLRARQGLITPVEAWQRLHAGFGRGRAGVRPEQTLAAASETMLRDRAFMRVYWSGAAIALLADLELRQRSGGRRSLDTVLAALAECCLPASRLWRVDEFLARLDALSGTRVFSRLAETHEHAADFPSLTTAYRRLGLIPSGPETLDFSPRPETADLRRAIMGGD